MNQNDILPAQLQTALDHLPSGLAIYRLENEQFISVYRNAAFYQVMGYSKEQIDQSRDGRIFINICEADQLALQKKAIKAMKTDEALTHTLRIFHQQHNSYRWIHLDGSRQRLENGCTLLYIAYVDITAEKQLEAELTDANEKMQDIVNAIPGGVAIYRVTDIFETVYFSDGVPGLTGYTIEEYRELIKRDAAEMTYPEDTPMVVEKIRRSIREHTVADFEFRKKHRDGHIVWVRVQAKQVGEADGAPLIHCVFHNISDLKEIQLEMNHLINATSGGVASYRVEHGQFIPTFYSDGVAALSGYNREEFDQMIQGDALNAVYEGDRARVIRAAGEALHTGEVLNISYRSRHKDGSLVWIHLNGRRIGPLTKSSKFYASFAGISEESRMYQDIANEAADAIYVIDRESYEVLYFHETKKLFPGTGNCIGEKCYAALHGKAEPCPFCNFKKGISGADSEVISQWNGRIYRLHYHETDWNGIPAFIQYLRDVTEEVETRQEKKRLEQYFQTLVESLPGGVTVVRRQQDGSFVPEFLSAGFADMTGTTLEEAWEMYRKDALAGVHPDDVPKIQQQLQVAFKNTGRHCELTYRLRNGKNGYIWVKNTLSMLPSERGDLRQYCYLRDITGERLEQERIREQYRKLILRHYRTPGPDALIIGHCNITQNLILEVNDFTGSDYVKSLGTVREEFFTAFSSLIVDAEQRQKFLDMYLNEPMLAAYRRKETVQVLSCLIQMPGEITGRYVRCEVNLVEEPDTKDITGILTVTDITEKTISEQVLKRLSYTGYDHIVVLDLVRERYNIFTSDPDACCVPPKSGLHTEWMAYMLDNRILPKDRENYQKYLNVAYIAKRLGKSGAYTFDFLMTDDEGGIRVKRMTVFAIDMRLGRVCLTRTDVTESVREQQSLLNMLAYTFDLISFIDVGSGRMTMYTRQTVLQDLSPYTIDDYDTKMAEAAKSYGATKQEQNEIRERLVLKVILEELERQPGGYDFVCASKETDELRYKKINILWGDRNHQTVCIVRADVTEMLAAERKNKQELENTLAMANQANQAKTAFLSSMSHDIRTPMNAIMGMTALAGAHPDDPAYVSECLNKISVSSKHLLNLINDILEMSKIERSTVELNRECICLDNMIKQVSTIIQPQAMEKKQHFQVETANIAHDYFYGDLLRINQILINILGNAVKFTPAGGSVTFLVEECQIQKEGRVRYRYIIRDTGIGMSDKAMSHIFEPFTRGSGIERVEGTGLGLSITKGLVDQMGGSITVESRVGEGSVFYVELEFERCPESEIPGKTGAQVQMDSLKPEADFLSGRCFLIAEDNAINAEILVSLLEMYGAKSVVEVNGAKVVEQFSSCAPGTYDAILMDIQMPEMNGYAATKAIRVLGREDAQTIPIIAMTANAFAEDVQDALAAGMTAHVAKPIDMDVLKSVLREVLQ